MGIIRFFVSEALSEDVSVPEGTVCTDAAGTEFITTEPGIIQAGELSCDVAAAAMSGGEKDTFFAALLARMRALSEEKGTELSVQRG